MSAGEVRHRRVWRAGEKVIEQHADTADLDDGWPIPLQLDPGIEYVIEEWAEPMSFDRVFTRGYVGTVKP